MLARGSVVAWLLLGLHGVSGATTLTALEGPPGRFTLAVTSNAVFDVIELGVSGSVSNGQNAAPIDPLLETRQFVSTTDGFRLLSPLGSPQSEGVFEPGLRHEIDLTYGVTSPVPGVWIDGFTSTPFLSFDVGETALANARLLLAGQAVATVSLSLEPGRLVGDFNADHAVDAADYTIWRDSLGQTASLAADATGDGVISEADRSVWVTAFGGAPTFAAASVAPEPSSAASASLMGGCAWFGILARRT